MNEALASTRTRFTKRWWFWVVIGVAIVISLIGSTAMIIRHNGSMLVRRTLAEHKALGLASSPQDVYAIAPHVERQELDALVTSLAPFGIAASGDIGQSPLECRPWSKKSNTCQALSKILAGWKLDLVRLENNLKPNSCLSSLARLPLDVPDPTKLWDGHWHALELPTLLSSRTATHALCWSALTEGQWQRLATAQQLVQTLQPANSVVESMMLMASHRIIDQAMFAAIVIGQAPADITTPWLKEFPLALTQLANGFRGERVCWYGQLVGISNDPLGTFHFETWLSDKSLWGKTLGVVFLPQDTALILDYHAQIEQRLRGIRLTIPIATMEKTLENRVKLLKGVSGLTDPGIAPIQNDTLHRCFRLAAVIIDDHYHAIALPADQPAFSSRYGTSAIDAQGDLPALRYEYLGGQRFRIGADPTAPTSDLIPSGHLTSSIGTDIGKPPDVASLKIGAWSLEIDLATAPALIRQRIDAVTAELTTPP